MKKAVAYLTPFLEAEKAAGARAAAARVVLATVKGDVHDIGKNIVGVVLACNNYDVVDLGVMVPAERIVQAAREQGADLIGVSGLITPSLEEMAHVARELERAGVGVPLLIGGATTNRTHTAVKIAPLYSGPVVHVVDASRAAGVAGSLVSREQATGFIKANRSEQEQLRGAHERKVASRTVLGLDEARRRRMTVEWEAYEPPVPVWTGVTVADPVPLVEIVPLIDWSPFFATWELVGTYPRIFDHPRWGARAWELYKDALRQLAEIVGSAQLTAKAVWGLLPAVAEGDDIVVFADERRSERLGVLHTLRQQVALPAGEAQRALADLVAPAESGRRDHIGLLAVTSGIGMDSLLADLSRRSDEYGAVMAQALADRLAEALAELAHRRLREAWGFGRGESLSVEELIRGRYQGIRPAPGYPACPDHSEKQTILRLLGAEGIGMRLTETCAMFPASSVCALVFSHPGSRYFTVGPIGRDQLEDYARRKGWDIETAERWLAPLL
jgi:5-methyltetrahydrofolate--homocysteine methyltransferase